MEHLTLCYIDGILVEKDFEAENQVLNAQENDGV